MSAHGGGRCRSGTSGEASPGTVGGRISCTTTTSMVRGSVTGSAGRRGATVRGPAIGAAMQTGAAGFGSYRAAFRDMNWKPNHLFQQLQGQVAVAGFIRCSPANGVRFSCSLGAQYESCRCPSWTCRAMAGTTLIVGSSGVGHGCWRRMGTGARR